MYLILVYGINIILINFYLRLIVNQAQARIVSLEQTVQDLRDTIVDGKKFFENKSYEKISFILSFQYFIINKIIIIV